MLRWSWKRTPTRTTENSLRLHETVFARQRCHDFPHLAKPRIFRTPAPSVPRYGDKGGIVDGRRRYFRVTDGKNNLALPLDKLDWFRSESICLGNGDPNDPND